MSEADLATGANDPEHYMALPKGTKLSEFEILSVLGQGGFGITYRAFDTLLHEDVAIKEYLPNEMAVRVSDETVRAKSASEQETFRSGLSMFLEEARLIARFRHPNIMQVRRFFEMNGTGYIVLEYERGQTLSKYLNDQTPSEDYLKELLSGILNGLETVHNRGILHRDLKPSNIIVRENGTPVLIDFGAARDFTANHSRSITAIAAPGYSPPEQYGVGGQQGPWTDIYALGATMYRCITGAAPIDSLRRLRKDPMVPTSVAAKGKFNPKLLEVIDWMMEVDEANRPESIADLRKGLDNGRPTGSSTSEAEPPRSTSSEAAEITYVRIVKGSKGTALLDFGAKAVADIVDLAFHVKPPGRYLRRASSGGVSFNDDPQYISLDRTMTETGQSVFQLERELVAAIPPGANVEISSSDNFIRAASAWPVTAPPARSSGIIKIAIILLLLLVGATAIAMNLEAVGNLSCDRMGLCTADRVAFTQVQSCTAAARPCEAASCFAGFKANFQQSRLFAKVKEMEDQTANHCRASQPPASTPPVQSRTPEPAPAANPAPPIVPPPVTPPPVVPPPPVAEAVPPPVITPPPPPAPAPTPPVALTNGTYSALQSYTGPKSRSDPRNCPPRDPFSVQVNGGAITYARPDFKDGRPITRYWRGFIDQSTGRITIRGVDADPPTRTPFNVFGPFASAEVLSEFCGSGVFSISR